MLVGNLAHHRADAPRRPAPAARPRGPKTCCYLAGRQRIPEERYFSFTFSPIQDETGGVGGVLTPSRRPPKSDRRTASAHAPRSGRARAQGEDFATACRRAADTLAENPLTCRLPCSTFSEADRATSGGSQRASRRGARRCPEEIMLRQDKGDDTWPLGGSPRPGRRSASRIWRRGSATSRRVRWTVPPARFALPIVLPGPGTARGVLVAGSTPQRLDDDYRAFSTCSPARSRGVADARAYEEERQRADALAETRPREDGFLLQCQPRVPHAADADARAARGRSRATPRCRCPPVQRERLETAHRNALRLLKLVNTLLDFSRIEAGRVQATLRADRSGALTARVGQHLPFGLREGRAVALVVDCRAVAGAGLCRPGDVGEDRPQPRVERLQVHLRGRDHGRVAREATGQTRCCASRTPAPAFPKPSCRACSSASTASKARAAGRTKAPASVSRWFRSWWSARRLDRGREHARTGQHFHRPLPFGTPTFRRTGSPRRRGRPGLDAPGARLFVEEALRWLPDAADEPRPPTGRSPPTGRRRRRRRACLVADDNADMRDYLSRLLRTRYDVTAVADGEAALAAARERPARSRPDRRDDAAAGRRSICCSACAPIRRCATIPVILLSARAGEEARSRAWRPGPTTIWSSRSAPASCSPASPAHSSWPQERARTASILRDEAHRLEILNRTAGVLAAEIGSRTAGAVRHRRRDRADRRRVRRVLLQCHRRQRRSLPALYAVGSLPRDLRGFSHPRNTAVFAPTFSGEGIVRSGDIRKDPRYGRNAPNQGPPPGHLPVVSYLAVPVVAPNGRPGAVRGRSDRRDLSRPSGTGPVHRAARGDCRRDRQTGRPRVREGPALRSQPQGGSRAAAARGTASAGDRSGRNRSVGLRSRDRRSVLAAPGQDHVRHLARCPGHPGGFRCPASIRTTATACWPATKLRRTRSSAPLTMSSTASSARRTGWSAGSPRRARHFRRFGPLPADHRDGDGHHGAPARRGAAGAQRAGLSRAERDARTAGRRATRRNATGCGATRRTCTWSSAATVFFRPSAPRSNEPLDGRRRK